MKPFKFSLIKRTPEEPLVVLSADFGDRKIPWNQIIEVSEIFPQKEPDSDGLTKREYFAAMAMQGMLSNPHCFEEYTDVGLLGKSTIYADALIAELNKEIGVENE